MPSVSAADEVTIGDNVGRLVLETLMQPLHGDHDND